MNSFPDCVFFFTFLLPHCVEPLSQSGNMKREGESEERHYRPPALCLPLHMEMIYWGLGCLWCVSAWVPLLPLISYNFTFCLKRGENVPKWANVKVEIVNNLIKGILGCIASLLHKWFDFVCVYVYAEGQSCCVGRRMCVWQTQSVFSSSATCVLLLSLQRRNFRLIKEANPNTCTYGVCF